MCNYLAYFQFAQRQKGKLPAEGDTHSWGRREIRDPAPGRDFRAQISTFSPGFSEGWLIIRLCPLHRGC